MTEENYMPDYCYNALNEVALKEGFRNYEVRVSNGSAKGDNFLGLIFAVVIACLDENNSREIKLIVKAAPTGSVRETNVIENAFRSESFAYTYIFSNLIKLQTENKTESAKVFTPVRCFFTSEIYAKEVIILENLNEQGFVMQARGQRVELDQAKSILATYAKFHGVSFAFNKLRPCLYKHIFKQKLNPLEDGEVAFWKMLSGGINKALQVARNSEIENKLKCFLHGGWKGFTDCLQPDSFDTLIHGDTWINNIMTKFQVGKEPEIRLLDFQSIRHGPPCSDILYFILSSTDGELRSSHYQELLDFYHDTLTEVLKEYSLDIDEVFPKEAFLKQVKTVAPFAGTVALLIASILETNPEDVLGTDEIIASEKLKMPTGLVYERYVKRVNDIMSDYIKYEL